MGGYTQADMPTYSGSFSGCFSLRQPDTHVKKFINCGANLFLLLSTMRSLRWGFSKISYSANNLTVYSSEHVASHHQWTLTALSVWSLMRALDETVMVLNASLLVFLQDFTSNSTRMIFLFSQLYCAWQKKRYLRKVSQWLSTRLNFFGHFVTDWQKFLLTGDLLTIFLSFCYLKAHLSCFSLISAIF